MKKTAIVLLMLSATSAQASELEYNIGFGLGRDNSQFSDSNMTDTYIFRAGVIANESHRFLGTYTFSNTSRLSKFIGSYDYLYSIDDEKKFNLVTGVSVGYKEQNGWGRDYWENSSDYVYGGQVGLNYHITKNISTEMGYRLLNDSKNDWIAFDDEIYLTLDYIF